MTYVDYFDRVILLPLTSETGPFARCGPHQHTVERPREHAPPPEVYGDPTPGPHSHQPITKPIDDPRGWHSEAEHVACRQCSRGAQPVSTGVSVGDSHAADADDGGERAGHRSGRSGAGH